MKKPRSTPLTYTLIGILDSAISLVRLYNAPQQDTLQRLMYNEGLKRMKKTVAALKPLKVTKKQVTVYRKSLEQKNAKV